MHLGPVLGTAFGPKSPVGGRFHVKRSAMDAGGGHRWGAVSLENYNLLAVSLWDFRDVNYGRAPIVWWGLRFGERKNLGHTGNGKWLSRVLRLAADEDSGSVPITPDPDLFSMLFDGRDARPVFYPETLALGFHSTALLFLGVRVALTPAFSFAL
ncbi:hypothetical protein AK812_SmicGene9817 [Symbiodinium microadriaticum]|uniref:Uncharacterized protein n=1 Tax=Symbiodinium microadriaticum TaxID=2951 RepID=A0A1Q9EHC3_SYMMI|nr:hypothetical protein AK812_SmicGene9817 [Symbiodinium microadriaticum]